MTWMRTPLFEWHRQRWHVLARSGADLLACETIPSYNEARALLRLLRETPGVWAWFSFSCRDEAHISDGTPIARCAQLLADQPQVVAVGVNCTPPRYIGGLIREITAVSTKPVIVYPNSGERYDPKMNQWYGLSDASEFGTLCREWRKAGCCPDWRLLSHRTRTYSPNSRPLSDFIVHRSSFIIPRRES
jgi:homocysteine S-methyltransferase